MNRAISSFMAALLLFAILVFHLLLHASSNAEVDALNAFKTNVVDSNNILQSWDATHINPCAWHHVTCNSENSTTRVDLQNAGLSGQLAPEIGQLPNLQYLELFSNNISGKIPAEFGNLTNLESLDLYDNRISGSIPETLGKLQKLRILHLYNNNLTGVIPMALTTVYSLEVLDLSNNQLEGDIPVNGSFQRFDQLSFAENPHLRPKVLTPEPPPSVSGNGATGAIAGGVFAGALLFTVFVTALVFYYRKSIPIAYCWKMRLPDYSFDVSAAKDFEVHFCQLKKFPLHELHVATNNFSNQNFLGRGGFGKVYKGLMTDGSFVAIKRIQAEGTQGGELQFQTEVITLSSAVHRNLLRLRGFCMTSTERLLVYPFMANGSVASCLRDQHESKTRLEWPIRKKIALGAARGLAYLHDDCNAKIIHRAVKAANILLDDEYEAVVGDFGLAKLMNYKDTHVTTAARGTNGYYAPEYLSTGRISEKTDVFGYGVMLLELITGQKAFDLARRAVGDSVMLLDSVKELWKDRRLETLIDADLGGEYNEEDAEKLIKLALLCTQGSAIARPKMSEVVKILEGDGLAHKWDQWQKNEINTSNNHTLLPNANWLIVDSTSNIPPDVLSAPR